MRTGKHQSRFARANAASAWIKCSKPRERSPVAKSNKGGLTLVFPFWVGFLLDKLVASSGHAAARWN